MRAVMLAAGVGRRLAAESNWRRPKILLAFDGRTLLARHVEILIGAGVRELVLVTGYRSEEVAAEAERVAPEGFVRFVVNPRYDEGSILSLYAAAPLLGEPDQDVLYMDADVLYHRTLIERLAGAEGGDMVPFDRAFEHGDEPVKVCVRGGRVVDFGKKVARANDTVGEWPGFLRLSGAGAAALAHAAAEIAAADPDAPAEDAIARMLAERTTQVTPVDVTGVPWIEIDFAADVERAEREIVPRLAD